VTPEERLSNGWLVGFRASDPAHVELPFPQTAVRKVVVKAKGEGGSDQPPPATTPTVGAGGPGAAAALGLSPYDAGARSSPPASPSPVPGGGKLFVM